MNLTALYESLTARLVALPWTAALALALGLGGATLVWLLAWTAVHVLGRRKIRADRHAIGLTPEGEPINAPAYPGRWSWAEGLSEPVKTPTFLRFDRSGPLEFAPGPYSVDGRSVTSPPPAEIEATLQKIAAELQRRGDPALRESVWRAHVLREDLSAKDEALRETAELLEDAEMELKGITSLPEIAPYASEDQDEIADVTAALTGLKASFSERVLAIEAAEQARVDAAFKAGHDHGVEAGRGCAACNCATCRTRGCASRALRHTQAALDKAAADSRYFGNPSQLPPPRGR